MVTSPDRAAGQPIPDTVQLEDIVRRQRALLAADPGNLRARMALGLTLHQLKRYDEALEALHAAAAAAPTSFEVQYNLGVVLAEQLRFDEAIIAYRAALAVQPHPYAEINLGLVLKDLGRTDEAVAAFERAARLAPNLPQAHLTLAGTLLTTGDAVGARDAIGRALALAPNDAEAHGLLAQALVQQQDFAGAIEACRRTLELEPAHMGARAYLAVLLQVTGQGDAAQGLIDYAKVMRLERFTPPPPWPDLVAFNAALADYIIREPSLRQDRATATQGGGQTLEILNRADEPVATIQSFFEAAVKRYIAEVLPTFAAPVPIPSPAAWRFSGWGVVLQSSGHQKSHFHPSGVVSGVYYVRIPEVVKQGTAGSAGHIVFGNPPPEVLPAGTARLLMASVKPEEGTLILFPSYLWHQTVPFDSREPRISLAFDVVPTRTNP